MLVAVTVGGPILAPAAPEPPVPTRPVAQDTKEGGTLPALEGRWLLVTRLGSGGGRRGDASLWEVVRTDGRLRLTERFVDLDRSKLVAGVEPTPAEVQTIGARWDTLPSAPRDVAHVAHEILGPDALGAAAQEPLARGALWIVRQVVHFTPGGARPLQEIRVLAADAEEATGYRGKSLTVVMAAAPLPVPIKVEGTFRLLRVPSPSASPWARLMDVLRGCN